MLVEHSGRAPRLEMVSFKKLNKGTLTLGVVFKVSVVCYQSYGVLSAVCQHIEYFDYARYKYDNPFLATLRLSTKSTLHIWTPRVL